MRIRTITAAAVTVLALALSGCSSNGDGKPAPATSSSTAPSPTPSATVDKEAARQACKDGWKAAMDTGDVDVDDEPASCLDVPGESAKLYAEALVERNAANRERMDECLEDPACTEFPIP
ncbi:hypothetical protein [Streptomyces osmaniensis]|uniref:Secreted protein n=1 Tax=Streptomyces osmaniensis TaxID=593134 RepID=A0ABP6YT89_9ACTN|nr:hypothetical protein KJK32_46555 [Streptomyces sp. JCM17656]